MHLSDEQFRDLVAYGPLISIDLIVTDAHGRALVGLRRNEPARETWFTPGGRIRKGESLPDYWDVDNDGNGAAATISVGRVRRSLDSRWLARPN